MFKNKKKSHFVRNGIFFCDPQRTNYAPFYGRFEEIGLLEVEAVFGWLQEFGLDVLLGIDRKFIYFFNMSYKVSNLH